MLKKNQRKGRRPARKQQRKAGTARPKRQLAMNPSTQNRQYANCVESSIAVEPLAPNLSYNENFTILQFPRAMLIAQNFKFYRAKRIVWEYNPDATVFQAGTGATAVPYAYYNMNRDGNTSSDISLQQLLSAGARPIKFVKKLTLHYKPNLSQAITVADNQNPDMTNTFVLGNTPIYDKWISTAGLANPTSYVYDPSNFIDNAPSGGVQALQTISCPQYFGHNILFQQLGTAENSLGFVTITVEWEFKDPVLNKAPAVKTVDQTTV